MPTPHTGTIDMGRVIMTEIKERVKNSLAVSLGFVQSVSVTSIEDSVDYTIGVNVYDRGLILSNVPVMTNYIDDVSGHFCYPKIGQLCIIGFMNNQAEDPVCLGFIRRQYAAKIQNEKGEVFLEAPQENMTSGVNQNNYIIKLKDRDIMIESINGAKILLKADGSFKLFNATNHGIEVDALGSMTIRGTAVNFTQGGGTWP